MSIVGVPYCWAAASFTVIKTSSSLTFNPVLIPLNNILKTNIISPAFREKTPYKAFLKIRIWLVRRRFVRNMVASPILI